MDYSVKSIREQFKAKGVFYTDSKMAHILRSYLPEDVEDVYDPTCGSGNLLAIFADNVKKFGQELNPEQAQVARERLTNAEIASGDTLIEPRFANRKFKNIIANYPFSVKWEPDKLVEDIRFKYAPCLPPPSKADYAFILHILHYLAEDGIASVLNFPGILYRGQKEGKIREWIIRQNFIDRVEIFEGGYFEDTKVATALTVFKKNRDKTSITFADHALRKEREVEFEEIERNGFVLSPNTYLEEDRPDPFANFDPLATEMKARNGVLKAIENQIKFSQNAINIHKMLGLPPLPPLRDFLTDIMNICWRYNE